MYNTSCRFIIKENHKVCLSPVQKPQTNIKLRSLLNDDDDNDDDDNDNNNNNNNNDFIL